MINWAKMKAALILVMINLDLIVQLLVWIKHKNRKARLLNIHIVIKIVIRDLREMSIMMILKILRFKNLSLKFILITINIVLMMMKESFNLEPLVLSFMESDFEAIIKNISRLILLNNFKKISKIYNVINKV